MTKTQAIELAGSRQKLASLLGISRQAVWKWKDDAIPPLQLYRLKERKPGWFRKVKS